MEYTKSTQQLALEEALRQQAQSRPVYSSRWEERLEDALEQVLNRKGFSYDLRGDNLFRQYMDQAVKNGKRAMVDAMGQASALTGGYGNSYAQSLGQQAYQAELDKVNDRIPELYRLALDAYTRQQQEIQRTYDILLGRENGDLERYQAALNQWQQDRDHLQEMLEAQRDFDYGAHRDAVEDAQWEAEQQEDRRRYDQEWAARLAAASAGGRSSGGGGRSSGGSVPVISLTAIAPNKSGTGTAGGLGSIAGGQSAPIQKKIYTPPAPGKLVNKRSTV